MASRNGSPGSHSVDTAARCCTQRNIASRSERLSRASRSAYSSGGPGEKTHTVSPMAMPNGASSTAQWEIFTLGKLIGTREASLLPSKRESEGR